MIIECTLNAYCSLLNIVKQVQNSRKTFKNAVKLICNKICFIQLFSRMTFNGCSRQQKTIVNVIKFIESVINEFDRKRKCYWSYWFCQISVGFTVFCKKILTDLIWNVPSWICDGFRIRIWLWHLVWLFFLQDMNKYHCWTKLTW